MDIYNSNFAKVLGFFHNEKLFAITTSKNCCRYSCDKSLISHEWFNHEEIHKKQFERYGWFRFIILYLLEIIRHGYKNNKFEIEARGE